MAFLIIMAITIIFIQSFLCSFSLLLTKKDFAYFKDFGSFISFPFFAKKKEKKRKQRKGKHAIKMNELSETTFPNLPFEYGAIIVPNIFPAL